MRGWALVAAANERLGIGSTCITISSVHSHPCSPLRSSTGAIFKMDSSVKCLSSECAVMRGQGGRGGPSERGASGRGAAERGAPCNLLKISSQPCLVPPSQMTISHPPTSPTKSGTDSRTSRRWLPSSMATSCKAYPAVADSLFIEMPPQKIPLPDPCACPSMSPGCHRSM